MLLPLHMGVFRAEVEVGAAAGIERLNLQAFFVCSGFRA